MSGKIPLLDLFSGIGGFSLGLEASGYFETVAFCDIEPFPRRVLADKFSGVPIYDDVRSLNVDRLRADGIVRPRAICGGFPCQDVSVAGAGEGLDGERSGLWFEYARLIRELRPDVVFVENVAALLGRGLDRVLGTLAALGYDAEWHCIQASDAGAPHLRDRLWLVAYPDGVEWRRGESGGRGIGHGLEIGQRRQILSDADGSGRQQQRRSLAIRSQLIASQCSGRWSVEPALGRMAHGVPDRVAALKGLGNAVVPVIPEILGRVYGAEIVA